MKLTEIPFKLPNSFKKAEEIDSPFSFLKGEDPEIINIIHPILESSNLHYLLKERMILTALNTEEQRTKYHAWTQEWKEFPKELLEVLSEEQRQMDAIKNRDWYNPKLARINVPNCKEWQRELYNWKERIKTGQKKVKPHLDWMFYVAQWHLKKYKKHKKLSSPEKIIAKKVELYKYYNEGIIVKKQRKSSNRYVASTGEQDNGETNKCQCIFRSSPITKITTTFDALPGRQNDDSFVMIPSEGQSSEKDGNSSLSQEMGFENVKFTTYVCSECRKKEVSSLCENNKGESSDTQPFVFINEETHIQDPSQDEKSAEEKNQAETKTIQNIDIVEKTLKIEVESSPKLESNNQSHNHIEDYEKTKSGKNSCFNGINMEEIPDGSGQILEAARLADSSGNNASFNANTRASTKTPSYGNSLKGNGNQDNISISTNTRLSTFSKENGSEIHLEKENPDKKSIEVAIPEQIESPTSQQTYISPRRTQPPFPKLPKKESKICPSNNCPSIIMTKENDPDAYNIILLGESGVGKTTLFNSIANYLQYGSYEEAFEKPMFLSDISFYITVNSKPQLISVKRNIPTDGNETSNYMPLQYPFMQEVSFFNESSNSFEKLRILDTPGIRETKGGDSLENILHAAKQMRKIHGICILLRPDEAEMKQQFRLTLNTLLSNLDKDAISNIFFVFTKVQAPGLMPGDGLALIIEYLKESKTNLTTDISNIFRFDNGWFRNVCIGAHNKSSGTNYPVSPSNSWMYSKDEFNRLMNRLETLEPYQMEKSSFLNEIKQLLFDLAEPIGEAIFKKIKRKEEIKEKKEELSRERDVKLSQSQIKSFGRIRCLHCREKVNGKSSDKICFKTSKYDITTLDFAIVPKCSECDCFMSMHSQDKSEAEEIYEEEIKNSSMINNKINELSDEEKELEDDFNQIVKTCSNLLAFLNANTIVTGIDPLLNYFNILHQMEIDKEEIDHLYKSYYLEDIRSFRDHYNETSKFLKNPKRPNLEEIKKELSNNKYYGECFKTDNEWNSCVISEKSILFPLNFEIEKNDELKHDIIVSDKENEMMSINEERFEAIDRNVINILVIGNEGVGKTTFINSCANYLTRESKAEALESPVILEDVRFNVYDKMHNCRIIEIGSTIRQRTGQAENVFSIKYSQGDVRKTLNFVVVGAETTLDLDKLAETIKEVGKIHLLSFLLRPNTFDPTISFRQTFKQMIDRFGLRARNISFCFTSTYPTRFRPDSSLNLLRIYLENLLDKDGRNITATKENIFCFDNDCFRFICSKFCFPDFEYRETDTWDHSKAELNRMLVYAQL